MGLADRHYMREPTSHWRFSATVSLIIALAIAFVFQKAIISPHVENHYLALSLTAAQAWLRLAIVVISIPAREFPASVF